MATESRVRERKFAASRLERVVQDESVAVALVLSGVVLLAIVVRLLLTREIVTPWIMADELIYSELAKTFADGGDFLFRDTPSHLNNVAYPALIAPAWFADSMQETYALARAINVALMVLAAVPVYFWGKRLMSPGYALLAPFLVLLMPSLLYTGMLMTENAFFLAVVTACFTIALTLERPTLLHQALALGAIGVACVVRPQGLVLLLIYATALALKLVFDLRAPDGPRGGRYVLSELRRYVPTALVLMLLGGGYVALNAFRGTGLESGLASYGGVVKVEYDLPNVAAWVVDHFAEISLSVGVIPVSALIVLFGLALRGWPSSAAERAFLAVATPAFVLVVIEVGIYASRFALRIEERNMFCVAPVLFLALSLWIARGLPRPVVLTAVAALAPAALLFSLDLRNLLNIGILSDTFALIPLLRLSGLIDGVDRVELLMRVGGFGAALAFALLPRRVARAVLPSGVAIFLVLSSYSVFGSIRDFSRATLALTSPSDPSWIDETIGPDSEAAFLYGGTADLFGEGQIMWQTEFWNRSVGTIYNLGPPDPAAQSPNASTFDVLTGRILSEPGRSVRTTRYVVAASSVELIGRRLAQQGPLALYRVEPPMRLASLVGGIFPDSWMGSLAALTHYATPTRPGRLSIRVSREGWGGPSPPGNVTIKLGPLTSQNGHPAVGSPAATRTFTVRSRTGRSFVLPTPASPYRLEIHVDPTFSPADYGQPDPRQLGAQVSLRFAS